MVKIIRNIELIVLVGLIGMYYSYPLDEQLEQEALRSYLNGMSERYSPKSDSLATKDEFKFLLDTFKADLVNRLYQKIREESQNNQSSAEEKLSDVMKRSSYKNSAKLAFSGLIGKLHSSG